MNDVAPRTLLAIAGAAPRPATFASAALVLIDHQLEYLSRGGLPLTGIESAIAEAAALLRMARSERAPVFHVVHHARKGAPLFDPDGPSARIIEALEPSEGEAIVIKSLPNAFAGTDLREKLERSGRREIVVAGFATHMCVGATVRAALDLGIPCTIVASATATRDLPDPLTPGGVVSAAEVQRAALAALADRFAVVVPDVAHFTAVAGALRADP